MLATLDEVDGDLFAAELRVLQDTMSIRGCDEARTTHVLDDVLLAQVVDLRCSLYAGRSATTDDEAEQALALFRGRGG